MEVSIVLLRALEGSNLRYGGFYGIIQRIVWCNMEVSSVIWRLVWYSNGG